MGKVIKTIFYKDYADWFDQICMQNYKELSKKYTDEQIIKILGDEVKTFICKR